MSLLAVYGLYVCSCRHDWKDAERLTFNILWSSMTSDSDIKHDIVNQDCSDGVNTRL